MKSLRHDTAPEEAVRLGRELERFRPSTSAVVARAFGGPVLLLSGVALLGTLWGWHASSPWPVWPPAVLGLVSVLLGVRGIRPFVTIVLLQLRIHEHGFVLRGGDGTHAALWEAIREVRVERRAWGVVSLGVQLVHGGAVEIAEDVGELCVVEARFRAVLGAQKLCG